VTSRAVTRRQLCLLCDQWICRGACHRVVDRDSKPQSERASGQNQRRGQARGLDEASCPAGPSRGRVSLPRAALALALCGESNQAKLLREELTKRYPEDTVINSIWPPLIRAGVELRRGNPEQAIEQLQATTRYETAAEFWPQYLHGLAYLKLNRGAEAAAEFQNILGHRGYAPLSPLYSLAHLGLARGAALMGDTAQSRKAYEDFFAVWKEADPDVSPMIEAKKEYSRKRASPKTCSPGARLGISVPAGRNVTRLRWPLFPKLRKNIGICTIRRKFACTLGESRSIHYRLEAFNPPNHPSLIATASDPACNKRRRSSGRAQRPDRNRRWPAPDRLARARQASD
jgi:tetratricopeptide (TPR) repeat protein